MATKIRGISIEISGDTTGLTQSLKGVNGQIAGTQKQLRDVERLLKLDPTNTELLAQKQKLLSQAVNETRDKLEKVKDMEALANKEFAAGKIGEEQYDAIKREVAATTTQLESLEKRASESNATLGKVSASLGDVSSKAESVAEATKGMSTAATLLLGAAAAAAGKVISAFADTEQLEGGIETLFKDSAATVEKYANQAYKSAGLSANAYMETVTGFSASLISSLGGNTAQAAEYANMAITDMSDNANKMGTDMSSIQYAYQGFAKQTYTMLDNLKLGYGGTKQEMERLLADAGRISGFKFDISSYADVVQAIHIMQESMGIAGTTAKEAEETISGSVNAAKSAIGNLVAGLGDSSADIDELIQNVVESVGTAAQNIIPVLKTMMDNLPDGIKIALGIAAIVAVISPLASLIANVTGAVSGLITIAPKIAGLLASINPGIALTVAAMGALVLLAAKLAGAWDDMSGMEKVISVLGLVTAAALTAAIALGAFQSAATMGVAAVGIVAGVTAVLASISMAEKRAKQMSSSATVPAFANGGSLTYGSAVVGEAGAELLSVNNGRATVRPLSGPAAAAVNNRPVGGTQNVTIEFTGSLAQLGRVLQPVIKAESNRVGPSLVR